MKGDQKQRWRNTAEQKHHAWWLGVDREKETVQVHPSVQSQSPDGQGNDHPLGGRARKSSYQRPQITNLFSICVGHRLSNGGQSKPGPLLVALTVWLVCLNVVVVFVIGQRKKKKKEGTYMYSSTGSQRISEL